MSTRDDVDTFVSFLLKTFLDQGIGSTITPRIKDEKVCRRTEKDRDSEATLVPMV